MLGGMLRFVRKAACSNRFTHENQRCEFSRPSSGSRHFECQDQDRTGPLEAGRASTPAERDNIAQKLLSLGKRQIWYWIEKATAINNSKARNHDACDQMDQPDKSTNGRVRVTKRQTNHFCVAPATDAALSNSDFQSTWCVCTGCRATKMRTTPPRTDLLQHLEPRHEWVSTQIEHITSTTNRFHVHYALRIE
jgi:hypothetical protein